MCGLALVCGPLLAQDQPQPTLSPQGPRQAQPSPLDGRLIREVRFTRPMAGNPDQTEPAAPQDELLARNQVRSIAGTPYNAARVSEDVRLINRLGRFGMVRSFVEEFGDGSVAVVFVLASQPVIEDVQSVGNTRLSDQKIADLAKELQGTPVDEFAIDRVARKVEDEYRKRGYYLAQVTPDMAELAETGILYFRVREGERLRVTSIRFEGNDVIRAPELRPLLKTRERSLLEKAPLDEDVLDADVARIVSFYLDRGYLDVRADRQATYSPNGREAIVTFHVDEGRRYTLRQVRVEYQGESAMLPSGIYSVEQLIGMMAIKPGDVYSIDALRRSVRSIQDAYGIQGYTDARVTRLELRDERLPVVDLLLRIDEGPRYFTGEVIIRGNTHTRQDVIRRQMRVRPNRPLDVQALTDSEKALRSLRLFSDPRVAPGAPEGVRITLQEPAPARPFHRDVLVQVDETNTGAFDIGGAIDSDSGVFARVAVTQRNFNLFDYPDSLGELLSGEAFRGGGQTAQIELLPGDRVSQFSATLTEPYLMDSDYSLSNAAFYRTREYTAYDEQRYGGRVGLGRKFGSRWNGSLRFRGECVDPSNIEENAPVDYFDVEESSLVDGIELSFNRTTSDDRFVPTRGNRIEVAAEQVGLLSSDYDFSKLRAEYAVYIPLYQDFTGRTTVLEINTQANYIPQDSDDVPFFERYYLGGRSFRGFGYRAVSPIGIRNDTGALGDDPVGGTWSFFLGLELRQPLYDRVLTGAIFLDTGTVTDSPGFDDYRVSVGLGLRVLVPALSPVPLAFDFGIPLIKEETDRTRLFTFTIDVPFN